MARNDTAQRKVASPKAHTHRYQHRLLRISVFLTLLISALAAFFESALDRPGVLFKTQPTWTALISPLAFAAFIIAFSWDRVVAVRRRRCLPSRALAQLAIVITFATLLSPPRAQEVRHAARLVGRRLGYGRLAATQGSLTGGPLEILLHHTDAEVRRAACALVLETLPQLEDSEPSPLFDDPAAHAILARAAQSDPAPKVRSACHTTLLAMQAASEIEAVPTSEPDAHQEPTPSTNPDPQKAVNHQETGP